jgi:hypothetical protein
MENGTYLKLSTGELVPIKATTGYWVAIEPKMPQEIIAGQYLGVWTDEKDGKEYYDRSVFVADLDTALDIGKLYEQIAIWDNANQTEIYVDYSIIKCESCDETIVRVEDNWCERCSRRAQDEYNESRNAEWTRHFEM